MKNLKIDIGCAGRKRIDCVGVDIVKSPDIEYVIDQETLVLPFPDQSVAYIHAAHFLSRIPNRRWDRFFKEISRVAQNNAVIEIWQPHVFTNAAFLAGQLSQPNEDQYLHMCVWFSDIWRHALGAQWLLQEICYIVDAKTLVQLHQHQVELDFALHYYKEVIKEFGVYIIVQRDDNVDLIMPHKTFALARETEHYLVKHTVSETDEDLLQAAIKEFSAGTLSHHIAPNVPSAPTLPHRLNGYELLHGNGLEIGALHEPAHIPDHCHIEYCDADTKQALQRNFPELAAKTLVEVDHICDLDKQGLSIFSDDHYDFVIFNHVVEHVANPIRALAEIYRVTKPNGLMIISAPDKDFTYDKPRELTSFEHLWEEYQQNTTEITDEHYLDFIEKVRPDFMELPPEEFQQKLKNVRKRREHVHVWTADSFKAFLLNMFKLLELKAHCVFEHSSQQNGFEYFSVWQKDS